MLEPNILIKIITILLCYCCRNLIRTSVQSRLLIQYPPHLQLKALCTICSSNLKQSWNYLLCLICLTCLAYLLPVAMSIGMNYGLVVQLLLTMQILTLYCSCYHCYACINLSLQLFSPRCGACWSPVSPLLCSNPSMLLTSLR